ncbi:MAG: hypothetical protein ACYDBB_25275 [Armatimonadota bacterium]
MRQLRRLGFVAAILAVLIAGGALSGAFVRPARAVDIGDILKIGGIVLVVSTFGDQINSFINNLLGQREAASVGATKVVPIFSVGQGAYVGAAQVVGVPSNVQRVQGVAALDVTLGNISGTGLVPISTRTPGRTIDRVGGVGISAIIDFHI